MLRKETTAMVDVKDVIPVREAAKLTGYSPEYIRRLCRENKIEHEKFGSTLMVNRESLIKYKKDQDEKRK
jgi:excisionase family DNA binding protein